MRTQAADDIKLGAELITALKDSGIVITGDEAAQIIREIHQNAREIKGALEGIRSAYGMSEAEARAS